MISGPSVNLTGEDFIEYERLNKIAHKYKPKMRLAYTRAMIQNGKINKLHLYEVAIKLFTEVIATTANEWNLIFNHSSDIYPEAIANFVEQYVKSADNGQARQALMLQFPWTMSQRDKAQMYRLSYGLDSRSALKLESLRESGMKFSQLQAERNRMVTIRGNLLANTETSRAVNMAWLSLLKDNFPGIIYKNWDDAEVIGIDSWKKKVQQEGGPYKVVVTSGIEDGPGKTCKYCKGLKGLYAPLNSLFVTPYGNMDGPPFHPNCECILVVRYRIKNAKSYSV